MTSYRPRIRASSPADCRAAAILPRSRRRLQFHGQMRTIADTSAWLAGESPSWWPELEGELLGSAEACCPSAEYRFGPVGDGEFGQYVRYVVANRFRADAEAPADVWVTEAGRDQCEDLALAFG
jgi:hypothetical protein